MAKTKGDKPGYNPRSIPEGKTQVNLNMPTALHEKIKYIAFAHEHGNSEVYIQAVEKFIELYEKKNGVIKVPPKKKSINL